MVGALALYMIFGAIAGVLAGLLGVGGGLIIVPIITYTLVFQGIDTPSNHLIALGTSLASIMFTSISSFMAHHKNGAVIWSIFKQIVLGILLGTFFGSKIATLIPIDILKGLFVAFLYYVGTQMLLNIKPNPTRDVPGFAGNTVAGGIIGIMSSLVGIGGGTLSVPYMTWCNVPMHKAIGTSAAIGFPIAVAGCAGYMVNGMGVEGLPPYSIGYVYLPALAGLVCASVCTAPLGARLAHRLSVPVLKRYFALLLYVIATQMLYKIITA